MGEQVNTDEAPIKYRTTWISTIVVMCFTIVAAVILGVVLARENRRRDREASAPSIAPTGIASCAVPETLKISEKGGDGEKHKYRTDDQDGSAEGLMRVDRDLTDWEDKSFRYSL